MKDPKAVLSIAQKAEAEYLASLITAAIREALAEDRQAR